MHVTLMLCDYAVVAEEKLYISGGGWTVAWPRPVQCSIAIKISVPWDRANEEIAIRLELVDADGAPVLVPGDNDEPTPLLMEGTIEVGRPPGLLRGTPIDAPVAIQVPPFDLAGGQRFRWNLSLGGESHEDWQLPFSTSHVPPEFPLND